jgi:hypothetical protein
VAADALVPAAAPLPVGAFLRPGAAVLVAVEAMTVTAFCSGRPRARLSEVRVCPAGGSAVRRGYPTARPGNSLACILRSRPGIVVCTPVGFASDQRPKERRLMKNVWKGLILGAVAGAAAGAGLDRRGAQGAAGPVLSAVHEHIPSASRVRDGVGEAADRLRDADVGSTVAETAGALRDKLEGAATDSRVVHAVKDSAAKVATSSGELAHAVKDRTDAAVANSRDAAASVRAGLSGP